MSAAIDAPRVDAVRPDSAWLLVCVAGACLWITGQIDLRIALVQSLAILFSYLRRERPLDWQHSALLLNLILVAIVALTIRVALRGGPSTIPLAYFAALTQGLQLLDARPRKTEFLLVTLALFQVVLASNLTDSVFFPPLLVVFVVAAAWTLIVHTLRAEAIAAGLAPALQRASHPGLWRMALVASLGSVALALVFFLVLPRLRSNVIRGIGAGPALAISGFSDSVELGDIGRIRQDPTVVMRVETLEGEAPERTQTYWRGLAFDHFDGRTWKITPPGRSRWPGSAEGGVQFGFDDDPIDLVQRIVREPVAAGVIFAMGRPRTLQGSVRRLERDSGGGLYSTSQEEERIRYTVASQIAIPNERRLARDRALPARRLGERDLQLPDLAPEVHALARRIIEGATSDAERVRAIERYLAENGRYTDTPPDLPAGSTRSAVEAFLLGGMSGHCEYFASAMVILARSVGIPARLVNGFSGGRRNRIGGFVEIAHSDAHAWVEVHYEEAGWIPYDPTPSALRFRSEKPLSLAQQLREFGSAIELWWFQRVVGFDRSDQMGALQKAWLAWQRRSSAPSRPSAAARGRGWAGIDRDAWREALPWVGGLLVLAGAGFALARARRAPDPVPPEYRRALRRLAVRGLQRNPGQTARAFAAQVLEREERSLAEAFLRLSEAYLAVRFGGADPRRCDERGRDFEQALRAAGPPGRIRPARSDRRANPDRPKPPPAHRPRPPSGR